MERENKEFTESDAACYCPSCGTGYEEKRAFCENCGAVIDMELAKEQHYSTALEQCEASMELVDYHKIDMSKALKGNKVIAKQVGDRFEIITAPTTYPVYILNCTDLEAEVLRTDYMLKKCDLTTSEKIKAYVFLSENLHTVKALFGDASLDSLYKEDTMQYIRLKDVSEKLLETNIPYESLAVLSTLSKIKQEVVAKVLTDLQATHFSTASAREIVNSVFSEEAVKNAALQDERVYEMIFSMRRYSFGNPV